MPFNPKKTRKKVEAGYKSLYLHQNLIDAIEKIAQENETSFNNVVVSMIEQCLEDIHQEEQQEAPEGGSPERSAGVN